MEISELAKKLKKHKLDGYIVTRSNMFLGQDIRDEENTIKKLTGFSGSAGTLLILPQKSILFIDGRYELQAPREVDTQSVEVFCTKNLCFEEWLNQNMNGKNIGYNPWAHPVQWLRCAVSFQLIPVADFLPLPMSNAPVRVFEHEIKFCGRSREDKINDLKQFIREKNIDACFIASADIVSWLFNLRSDALPDTPVFRSMALINTDGGSAIFTGNTSSTEFPADIKKYSFSELHKHLKKLKKHKIGYFKDSTPAAFLDLTSAYGIEAVPLDNICAEAKAVKNECELAGIRQAHLRDGVAVCKFLYWLEHNWRGKTELDIVQKLHNFRTRGKNYFSESFETIAGFNANGAIIHYHPEPQTNKTFDTNGFLLLDSGAQYLDGTTDITRTIALGDLSPQMIDDFTLVLKGHIALSRCIFPERTSGNRLDILARQFLWQEGKDYHHGTGHGVGCFLNVHEGPHTISAAGKFPLQSGMITSIEPGFYLEDHYGIRIENMVEICPAETSGFLRFKNLTLVPVDKRAINKYLMSKDETAWLNDYHQEVFSRISPYLNAAETEWLSEACAPL